jgi:hypothetical protein
VRIDDRLVIELRIIACDLEMRPFARVPQGDFLKICAKHGVKPDNEELVRGLIELGWEFILETDGFYWSDPAQPTPPITLR